MNNPPLIPTPTHGGPDAPAPAERTRGAAARRRLIDAAAVLSLFMFLAAAASWAAGERLPAAWVRMPGGTPARAHFVAARGGVIYFVSQRASEPADGSWAAEVVSPGRTVVRAGSTTLAKLYVNFLRPRRTMAWFTSDRSPGVPMRLTGAPGATAVCTTRYTVVAAPPWLAACVLGVLPAARLRVALRRRRRDRRRIARGLCAACGYDLRATPGRCPECGKPAIAAPAT